MKMLLALVSCLCILAVRLEAKTLYVNGQTGNDATSYASNSEASPWQTVGRAAWGSGSRTAPNAAEAAKAGDIVFVAGGTYATSVAVNNRWGVVYNPVNNGTASAPITFLCAGVCVLAAPNANAPVIGSENRTNIAWIADVTQGRRWEITAYGLQAGTAGPLTVNTTPDTGPIVCMGGSGCIIEGATIDGGPRVDYTDNYNAIRVENSPGAQIRQNTIRSFRNQSNSVNGTAVTLYGSANSVVENNRFSDMGSGLIFKDHGSTLPQSGIRVRYNIVEDVDHCFSWSVTDEDRNYVYQNICRNSRIGTFFTGGGVSNDWVFNNTFVGQSDATFYTPGTGTGGRYWNNINVSAGNAVVYREGPSLPPATVFSLEHNLYFTYARFYTGGDGNLSFAEYKARYGQDQATPASLDADPLFVDPATNYHLQPGSPARTLGVDLADLDGDGNTGEVIPAGAYVTGAEVIGPRTSGLPSVARCANGLDDDADGLIDLADPGCASASDDDEANIAPPQCTFTIQPSSALIPAAGGMGNVSVTASAPTCTYAVSSSVPWLTVASSGFSVGYVVGSNTGSARSGTATIAGQTFTVNQEAAVQVPAGCLDNGTTWAVGDGPLQQMSDGNTNQREAIRQRIHALQRAGFDVLMSSKSTYTTLVATCAGR